MIIAYNFNIEIIPPETAMDEAARKEFINRFKNIKGEHLIGLVVSGGVFGESIDLADEMLIGSIIVGVSSVDRYSLILVLSSFKETLCTNLPLKVNDI